MTPVREKPHAKSCICTHCEARMEGEKAGAKLGRAVAAELVKHMKQSRSPKKGPKCLRCGAGQEWIEFI